MSWPQKAQKGTKREKPSRPDGGSASCHFVFFVANGLCLTPAIPLLLILSAKKPPGSVKRGGFCGFGG
jgi:hypothetical protein